ncbi:TAZ zinc finger, partial [Trichostrongylus colubriformis]
MAAVNMSVEQENVLTVPRSLKKFGTKEELREYLGDLIHALRSHVPCVYLDEGDPLWCEKVVPCLRRAYRWCHLHGCHSRGRCADPDCPYAWKLISHWYNCHSDLCFVCSPWVKPSSLHGQSRDFLAEIFGEKPLIKAFAELLTPSVYRSCGPIAENNEVATDNGKDDGGITDFEVDIRSSKVCVSLGVQADLRAPEVNKVPIHGCIIMNRRDYRVIMLYEFKLGHSAAEAARNVSSVF